MFIARSIALIILYAVTVFGQTADLILTNGTIWTGGDRPRTGWSIAVSGNRIVAVGDSTVTAKHRRPETRVIDLAGRFVMPGINDSHIHFLGGSLGAFQVDLSEAASLADAQARVRKFAEQNPKAPWITGFGWQYSIFPDSRLPTRADLDTIVKDRPVYLRAYDGHTAWANSKALELAGVTAKTEFSGFGELVRDETGVPTGTLKEGAMGLVSRHVPAPTPELELDALRKGFQNAASLGITSIQNAHGSLREVELYEQLLKEGSLTLRTSFAFGVNPRTTQADIDRIANVAKKYSSTSLKVGAVKIAVDGVIESYTAAMLAPYSNKPATSGTSPYTQEQLNNVVAMADKAGLQVYIHAIGDKGVRMAFDAFENAIRVNGKRDSRFRIEHIETIDPADVPRFKKLGVIASMEPIHADPGTIDVWSAAIGTERTSRGFGWRMLENAGARLIFSSDYPAAISMSPWRGLHNAVNRQTVDGKPANGWLPQHRVSVATALTAYTANGAFASFEENQKGRLQSGMLADVIVLNGDPFIVPANELHKLRVALTIFDGKVIFDADRITGK